MADFQFHVSVPLFPLQKYVRITFIRKISVRTPYSLRKNNVLRFRKFAVDVDPFI